ncbi:MAG TPA: PrsW family intramembrane metalloprotease [Pyrinomonadaceae bacterium]|nr:PrsW family intramembrane metalloprotease [Pyrinomonadaceae bacterium]
MSDLTGFPRGDARMPAGARPPRQSALRWVAGLMAALVALLLGLITLVLIGFSTGPVPFLAGLVVAVLPVPVYVMMALWVDRFEAEPAWLLAVAFFWGALVAVGIAIIVNSVGVTAVETAFGRDAADFYGLSISAPLVEEGTKALALFILFYWKRDEFDGVVDGIVYAAMVGLGFAMTENIKYYGEAVLEGRTFGTFVVRGMFSPYAHPLFTSMTGIGLGLASHSTRRATRLVMPAVGFALAVVLHSLWNTSLYLTGRTENGLIALVMYFLIMVPIFTGVLLTIFYALRREGRILREHLRCDIERGLLTPEEYERLCSVRGRMGATFGALRRRGVEGWRARTRFHGLASELAFQRFRVSRGVVMGGGVEEEREALYLHAMRELRTRLW